MVDFLASLVSEMLPVALPVVLGSKTALKDVEEPGCSVVGNCRPLMLKPDPGHTGARDRHSSRPGIGQHHRLRARASHRHASEADSWRGYR